MTIDEALAERWFGTLLRHTNIGVVIGGRFQHRNLGVELRDDGFLRFQLCAKMLYFRHRGEERG